MGLKLGVWAHPYSTLKDSSDIEKDARQWLENLRDAGVRVFAPFIMPGSGAHYFESSVLGTPEWEWLSVVLEAAREVEMEVHATIPAGQVIQDKGQQVGRGRYLPHDVLGRHEELPSWAMEWACPAWEEGRRLSVEMVVDLLRRYDLAGVNLDYVRYTNSIVSNHYPCACADCRRVRRSWLSKELPDADDWANPGVLYKEMEMRGVALLDLVRRISAASRDAGVPISLCARARYLKDGVPEGQDWAAWARDGLLDLVWPMSYNPCFDRFQRFIAEQEPLLRDTPAEFWPGVGRSSSLGSIDTDMMIRQIEYAFENGAQGVMIFHAAALNAEDYAALRTLSGAAH